MAKNFKRGLSAFLAALMCTSTMSVAVHAEDTSNFTAMKLENIVPGSDGYNYMIAQDLDDKVYYYETSNHAVKIANAGAVHIFPIIDTTRVVEDGTWEADGIYVSGESNYDVVYCCDFATGTRADEEDATRTYYKRMNLEDSEYFDEELAERLRAIVSVSYPANSVDEAQNALYDAGFMQAYELDRSELISATQGAIWRLVNADSIIDGVTDFRYRATVNTSRKAGWGGYMHNYTLSGEQMNFTDGKKDTVIAEIGSRITALQDFFLNEIKPLKANDDQIVITKIKLVSEDVESGEVKLKVQLNHAVGEKDDVSIVASVNGIEGEPLVLKPGDIEETITVEAGVKDEIKIEVTGTQDLARGVYFYAPKPQDIDEDGIATSREVSQNLIGVSEGITKIHAEKTFVIDRFDVDLTVKKLNENGLPLTGAIFELTKNGESDNSEYEVDENGVLALEDLLPGTYTLKETKAPEGYILPEEEGVITITIDADGKVTFEGEDSYKIDSGSVPGETVLYETKNAPQATVDLIIDKNTSNSVKEELENSTVKTVVAVREVTAQVTAVDVTVDASSEGIKASIQPALKFDRNSTADQAAKKKSTELYTDNGHFHDPSTFTVTNAPEGYPFKYVGHGDYSGHYISHVRVIYERDEAGNALKDKNGNYIIKELQHASSGTPLHYGKELTTNIDGPYHYATGTRPQQFLLMDKNRNTYYGYCIDLATGAEDKTWYALANLEDNDYYASEEAENHVRGIVFNGYWGTESGTGSLASLKEALKAAVAVGTVENDYNIKMVNRKEFKAGYELQEGEYHYGSFVYWDLDPVDVKLTAEIIDQMTEGEALDAMQAAIWSWANGSQATLNGVDGVVIGDLSAASSKMSDSLNGQNDPEGAARTRALYAWLMQQTATATAEDGTEEITTIINDKTFAKEMSLTVKGETKDEGFYNAALNFSLDAELTEEDELKAVLTYTDAYGVEQTKTIVIAGEGAVESENGMYTIADLVLKEGEEFNFSLNIAGKQILNKGAYIFTSEGGTNASQTFVTMAEGTHVVDVTKSVGIVFNVDDYEKVTYNHAYYVLAVNNYPRLEADKTSKPDENIPNRFEVSIEVPGGDEEIKIHDEVILMVDGSYSMDNEWPAMKEAITTIGKTVLNGSGNTQLTLMAFGMGDNEVLVHVKDADELAAALGELPGNLLYGRSSTNCEAGFTGVAEYIANHDDTLGKVDVIFISDGNINTDEYPSNFFDWQNNGWHSYSVKQIVEGAFALECAYISDAGLNPSNAYKTVFGETNAADMITWSNGEPVFKAGTATEDQLVAWANQAWNDAYEYSNLSPDIEYPVSDVERAFAKYDKEHNTHIQDAFYYALIGRGYPDRWTRTPAAADELAAMDEVNAMYVVDYDSYTAWMDTGITSEKSTFIKSNGIAGLCEALKGALTDLSKTTYNDVVITDYMSKWVNLDASTLKIVDNTTDEIIWSAAEGWKINENRPTAQEVPVVVELVDPAEYGAGGEAVTGNKSGDIYKLTWYVKDGALLRSDNYKLVYEVTVDTAEKCFESGKNYPANGNTDLHYNDKNNVGRTNEIEVPNINGITLTGTVILNKVDENGKPISGAEFELYKIEDGVEPTHIGNYKLDKCSKGSIKIDNLTVGAYKLVETKTPKGYIGVDKPMYFDIVATEDGKLEAKAVYELEFPATAYEISNHITSVAIPQTFVLLDAPNAEEWTYPGEFVFGKSDYDVVYCADSETGVKDDTKYYRTDLEDAFDGNEDVANALRAIVANSYPYVSMKDMIAAATAAHVADAKKLTRGDIIAAVQLAIWHYTNNIEDYEYKATYSVEAYPGWGKVFNDYSDELKGLPVGADKNKIQDTASEARIRALYNYLLGLATKSADANDIDVFVYVPQGGKDVSQMLIGATRTDFYTDGMEISVVNTKEVPPTITFKSGEASNISFMLIDKDGKVKFIKKIDIGGQTSFEIPTEEGKISAVFVKQSTSGMFWASEEIDEDTQKAVIDCLKVNNPSYKGYNAFAFGAGDHELEFKKNKFVTYTFDLGNTLTTLKTEATDTEATEPEATEPEATEPETPKPETPKPETPKPETPKPETPKPETPKPETPEEPTLNYTVKGAKIAEWTVADGVTAIYIAANGKVPAVIWASEANDVVVEKFIKDLGVEVDEDYIIFGKGSHKIEYQHNKNKTKTVTYTFSAN